jgi:2-dehydro-3-deoxygluconokinase
MKKIVTFGEIMLRLTPPGFKRFSQASAFEASYGGGESNVAVSLASFGLPATFVTRLPDNDLGHCAIMEMRKHGVDRATPYGAEIASASTSWKWAP